MAILLRDYQRDAVRDARAHLSQVRRLCLCLPTGGGKTVIAASILAACAGKGRRALFLAHRRELISQTARQLVAAGAPEDEVGVILAGATPRQRAKIQIASVQTLVRRECPAADLVFVDECHHAPAASYHKILAAYPTARVIGLTATPVRSDGRGLAAEYDRLHVVATPQGLIDCGYLAAPRVYSSRHALDLSSVGSVGGDYNLREIAAIMNQSRIVADVVTTWQARAEGRATVAFCTSVEHSQAVAAAFVAVGVRAEHLDGTTPHDLREAILARLESGETQVVANCGVLTEGWDCPRVKCLILARPTKSLGLYLQMSGRALRPWGGIAPLILDHGECALRHGLPQWPRDWETDFRATKSVRTGATLAVRSCPDCLAVRASTDLECECGYRWPVAERAAPTAVAGELVELVGLTFSTLAVRRAWYLSELTRAHRAGRKMGYARHRYHEKFGEWPRFLALEKSIYVV